MTGDQAQGTKHQATHGRYDVCQPALMDGCVEQEHGLPLAASTTSQTHRLMFNSRAWGTHGDTLHSTLYLVTLESNPILVRPSTAFQAVPQRFNATRRLCLQ